MKLDLKYLRNLILQEASTVNAEELALSVDSISEPGFLSVYLYTVPDVRLVGTAQARKLKKPCIPETWQVTSIAVEEDLQGQKLGFLLYKIIIASLNSKGYGATSDHGVGTKPKAAKFWKRLEDEGSIAIKRNTGQETDGNAHDTFDYDGKLTPDDPNDDCEKGMSPKPATDHSWALTDSVYAATQAEAKKLRNNNFKFYASGGRKAFVEKIPPRIGWDGKEQKLDFMDFLDLQANELFHRVYKEEVSDFKLMRLIKEELQVVLTNEEAAEMFGEDILEDLEVLDEEEKENNAWAICTKTVGRENKEKYEKCVKSVKNKER